MGIRALSGADAPIDVTYTGAGITIEGDGGAGIQALSGGGGIDVTSAGPITTDGSNAPGIFAESSRQTSRFPRDFEFGPIPVFTGPPSGEAVRVSATGAISTSGAESAGIWATSTNGPVEVSAKQVTTTGEYSVGIQAKGKSTAVNIATDGSVVGGWQRDLEVNPLINPPIGLKAAGVVLGATGGTATLTNNGSLGALSDRAVFGDPLILNNGTMTGFVELTGANDFVNNGTFDVRHFADTNGDGSRDKLRVSVSDLGDPGGTFANNGTLALLGGPGATTLDSTGEYLPHGNALNAMALAGPVQGQVLGATTFTNSGIINLQANPAAGDVLLVTGGHTAGSPGGGTFVANGGSLLLDTVLNNGAPSQSDVLVVDGLDVGAAGPTRILVRNAGGLGGLTVGDGILVIEGLNNVGRAAVPHAFGLGAPVVSGPYEYFLFRGGAGAGASDDWFLRNVLQPVIPPDPPVQPEPPVPPEPGEPPLLPSVPPGQPPTPIYRPEVSLYTAMPVAAAIYGRTMIDTLHERMGGNAQVLGPGDDGTYDGSPDGIWGRLIGHWGHWRSTKCARVTCWWSRSSTDWPAPHLTSIRLSTPLRLRALG
jgi:hypothetical protein